MLKLILISMVLTLAACTDDGNVTSGTGSDGQQVSHDDGADTDGGSGISPFGVNSFDDVDNPYQCPVNTVIRSDCSIVSQRECKCVLP